jgi:type IV pilus assembly protein PilV
MHTLTRKPSIMIRESFQPVNKQCGFTLLEVLIALLILSIGLLGLASLQTNGLRSNQMASMRTTATQLAYDIADRMRANPAGVDAQNYVIAANDADPVIPAGENCEGVTCTTSQMATYDLAQWRGATRSLPGGTSSIARIVTGAVVTHTVTIYWDEYRQGISGTACGPDPKVDLRCVSLTL